MAKVTLGRTPDTLEGFELKTPDDMVSALKFLSNKGYAGHINCTAGPGQSWTFGLMSPGQSGSQSAQINDWIIIKNGAIASVCPADQFAALYTVT